MKGEPAVVSCVRGREWRLFCFIYPYMHIYLLIINWLIFLNIIIFSITHVVFINYKKYICNGLTNDMKPS